MAAAHAPALAVLDDDAGARARAQRAFVDGREERRERREERSVLSWSEEKVGKGRRQTAKEERKKESAPLTKQAEKMQKKRKAVPPPPP